MRPRTFTDDEILAARPPGNAVAIDRPYAFLVEPERSAAGAIVDVATVFLTNRECPFRCLMCDLWKNTTVESVPVGAIPAQIAFALERLPATRHIKLYNSGNFFDARAIPQADHARIAEQVGGFEHVIIENHPRLVGEKVLRFRDRIQPATLEVAIGLETVHPEVLPALNKQMTLDDFERAVRFLRTNDIAVRTFILLRPPFLTEAEGVEWALRSIRYAFDLDIGCCSVVPTRGGNGILEALSAEGLFASPTLASMERVLEEGIAMGRGRVLMDLWDIGQFARCDGCMSSRTERMRDMNLQQRMFPRVTCSACHS